MEENKPWQDAEGRMWKRLAPIFDIMLVGAIGFIIYLFVTWAYVAIPH